MRFNGIDYNKQDQRLLTLDVAPGAEVGDAVTLTGNATVGRGSENDALFGKLVHLDGDGKGTVVRGGLVEVTISGSVDAGSRVLAVDGAGAVKVHTAGRTAPVIGSADGRAVIDLG